MGRRTTLPEDFEIPEIIKKDEDIITEIRRYRLITPLFGGGVESGMNDPVTPIRGTSIRGQLRFWWRACRGGKYKSLKELKENENKIWGSMAIENNTMEVNPVSLYVVTISEGKNLEKSDDIPDYVSFPLREKNEKIQGKIKKDIKFRLILTYSKRF